MYTPEHIVSPSPKFTRRSDATRLFSHPSLPIVHAEVTRAGSDWRVWGAALRKQSRVYLAVCRRHDLNSLSPHPEKYQLISPRKVLGLF